MSENSGQQLLVKARFNFQQNNEDELTFNKGDIINVTRQEEGGWWEGSLNGKTGWFPSNYVREVKGSDKQVSPKSGTLKSPPKGFDTSTISKTYYNLVLQNILETETKKKQKKKSVKMALRAALRHKCGFLGLLTHGRVPTVLVSQMRNNTTSPKIKVDFNQSTGVAVLSMQSPPVNSLSLDFLTELCISLEKLEMDRGCRGLIITSSLPKVFSAGLDILEMYGKSPERCGEFWRAVQEMWLKLYGSNMVTIAAINGSSPAGGCLMSMTCDYRIMSDNPRYSIGLNETLLGIVAPFWFKDTMVNTVGHRNTELALELGLLYSPSEALKIGLVDQLVPQDQLLATATETMTKWLAIPDHARQITKSMMRKPTIDKLTSNREADIQHFVNFITKDSIQKSLRMYLEMLKKRKA